MNTTIDQVDAKRLATARARIALWGGMLTTAQTDDGRPEYLVTRWAFTKAFRDLDEVDAFLVLVKAPGG